MIGHVHEALSQVRHIHQQILEKQRFKGYSGRARAIGGCTALLASLFLAQRPGYGLRPTLMVWIAVAAAGLILNFGAVLVWFLGGADRSAARLRPVQEVLPALVVGLVVTLVCLHDGQFHRLTAYWMMLYGLANCSSRHFVPRPIAGVGLYYIAAGIALIVVPRWGNLANPVPMGVVFFLGEWAAGLVMHRDAKPRTGWTDFFGVQGR